MGKSELRKIIRTSTVPVSLDVFCRGLLRELSADYEVIALSSPGKEMDQIAKREGVRTIAVPMERRISIYKDLLSLFRLIQVFLKEKPQMVHSMTPKAGLLSMTAAWIAKVPVRVHTFTGLVFPTAKGWRQKLLMLTDRITCACATYVTAEGKGVKNDLKNYGITRKKITILGNGSVRGIDLKYYACTPNVIAEAFSIKKRLNIHEGEFSFIFVGRLVGD
ncbi:MAG: glycosyltransferase, partial [Prevotella sp.]|nr:glycosyltransferase [Prevotella sp.]